MSCMWRRCCQFWCWGSIARLSWLYLLAYSLLGFSHKGCRRELVGEDETLSVKCSTENSLAMSLYFGIECDTTRFDKPISAFIPIHTTALVGHREVGHIYIYIDNARTCCLYATMNSAFLGVIIDFKL